MVGVQPFRAGGWQTAACVPSLACCLFLKGKFYWNTAMLFFFLFSFFLNISCVAAFLLYMQSWETVAETGSRSLKYLLSGSLQKRSTDPGIREGLLEKTWAWEEDSLMWYMRLRSFEKVKRWARKWQTRRSRWDKCRSHVYEGCNEVMNRDVIS